MLHYIPNYICNNKGKKLRNKEQKAKGMLENKYEEEQFMLIEKRELTKMCRKKNDLQNLKVQKEKELRAKPTEKRRE